jgi:hypothetical protein
MVKLNGLVRVAIAVVFMGSVSASAGNEHCNELRQNYHQAFADLKEKLNGLKEEMKDQSSRMRILVQDVLNERVYGTFLRHLVQREYSVLSLFEPLFQDAKTAQLRFARVSYELRNGEAQGLLQGRYRPVSCAFDEAIIVRDVRRIFNLMGIINESARHMYGDLEFLQLRARLADHSDLISRPFESVDIITELEALGGAFLI